LLVDTKTIVIIAIIAIVEGSSGRIAAIVCAAGTSATSVVLGASDPHRAWGEAPRAGIFRAQAPRQNDAA